MNYLALIPARGGSKGVPRKNIRSMMGKPLIGYTIDVARELLPDTQICVSTDSQEIKAIVESEFGLQVPFLRPAELATDEAGAYGVMHQAVQFYADQGFEADVLLYLQPTSPFRTSHQLKEAMNLMQKGVDMVVAVKETKANPHFNLFKENTEGWMAPFEEKQVGRRQDVPTLYEYTGSIYVIRVHSLYQYPALSLFPHIRKYEVEERFAVDIDTEMDWAFCEFLLEKGYV